MRAFLAARWGAETMAVGGRLVRPAELEGFVAEDPGDGRPLGLVTFEVEGEACEVASLDAIDEGRGVGTALLAAVRAAAEAAGCRRLRLTTTNDNRRAIAFYERRGFRVVEVRRDAVAEARRRKPEIPVLAPDGTPIEDEIELELELEPGRRR